MIAEPVPQQPVTILESSHDSVFADPDTMAPIYPFAAIRVTRIARDTEKRIGDFQLTEQIARQLDGDETGVLIANCRSVERIHEQLMKLADTPYPASWVVVASSIDLARDWYARQHNMDTRQITADSSASRFWRNGNCWFTRLEQLESLLQSPEFSRPVAGIILVDPWFQTQFARGLRNSKWSHNDRPELMNCFRTELAANGIRPPLLFMACPPAKSLNTTAALRAYCLETFWYADGDRLRIGALPTDVG